jgi:hypothetical protein
MSRPVPPVIAAHMVRPGFTKVRTTQRVSANSSLRSPRDDWFRSRATILRLRRLAWQALAHDLKRWIYDIQDTVNKVYISFRAGIPSPLELA